MKFKLHQGQRHKYFINILFEVTWVSSVSPGRIVQNEDAGQIRTDGGEILGVRSIVQGTVLPVVSPVQHPLVAVQLVRHRLPVDLHAGREDHQLEPLSNLRNKNHSRVAENYHRKGGDLPQIGRNPREASCVRKI